MSENPGNRPSEIFGYPTWNRSEEAQDARRSHWCPFQERTCNKKSRLIDFPFGVCSAQHGTGIHAICPHRFDEPGSIEGVPKVLEDIALHYFGGFDNTVVFSEVRLPNIGNPVGDSVELKSTRFISTTVDEVYQAMRKNPGMPAKDEFVSSLNTKLRLKLSVRVD